MSKRIVVFIITILVFTVGVAEARKKGGKSATFRNAIERKGFIVQEGKVDFPPIGDWGCACQLPSAYANNPSSPYGILVLPPAPNQDSSIKNPYAEWFYEDGHYPEDWSFMWRLRADEAVVFIGTTPPKMDYFGFTGYVYDRYRAPLTPPDCVSATGVPRKSPDSVKNRFPIFGSVGDTINNMTVNVVGDQKEPFNRTVVLVMVTDRRIEQEVRKTLLQAGYPDQVINTIVLSPSIARLGIESDSDTFSFLLRLASEKTPEVQQYMASSLKVFRVSPVQGIPASAIEPLASPKLRVRGTGETEISLLPAVDALGEAIKAHYPQYNAVKIATLNFAEGYNCIENGDNCLGDNRDTPYISPAHNTLTKALLQDMKLRDNEFYVIYGVNHRETEKATYSNVSILGWYHKFSPLLFNSNQMPGTADYYLGSSMEQTTSNKLYAWKVARVGGCTAGETAGNTPPGCNELGYFCESGIAADEEVAVIFRAYLEPKTMVGPIYGEIIIDRIVKFTPKP